MRNDFVEGMELLIDCKKLVEDLVKETKRKIELSYINGKDTSYLENELERYLKVLRLSE